jgi:hypothetical protein
MSAEINPSPGGFPSQNLLIPPRFVSAPANCGEISFMAVSRAAGCQSDAKTDGECHSRVDGRLVGCPCEPRRSYEGDERAYRRNRPVEFDACARRQRCPQAEQPLTGYRPLLFISFNFGCPDKTANISIVFQGIDLLASKTATNGFRRMARNARTLRGLRQIFSSRSPDH